MYTIGSDILSKCGYDTPDLDKVLAGTGLAGLGAAFHNLEVQFGINALFAIAHAFIESGRGYSWLAVNRNNIFGIAAFDSDPYQARYYTSKADCITDYGNLLKTGYLTPQGFAWGGGTTIHDIFVHYSSSHDVEALNIVNIMNQLEEQIKQSKNPIVKIVQQIKPNPQVNNPSYFQHVVQAGETLSSIATETHVPDWHIIYDANINVLNQELRNHGQPENNPNMIYPGTVLLIPLTHNQTVVPQQTITQQPPQDNGVLYITVPSGYNGYLSVIAHKYGVSVQQLIDWNKAKYPRIGTGPSAFIEAGWVIRVK